MSCTLIETGLTPNHIPKFPYLSISLPSPCSRSSLQKASTLFGITVTGFTWANNYSKLNSQVKLNDNSFQKNLIEKLLQQGKLGCILLQTVSYSLIGPFISRIIVMCVPRFLFLFGIHSLWQNILSPKLSSCLYSHLQTLENSTLLSLSRALRPSAILICVLNACALFWANPIAGSIFASFQLLSFISQQGLLPHFIKELLHDKLIGQVSMAINESSVFKSLLMTGDILYLFLQILVLGNMYL